MGIKWLHDTLRDIELYIVRDNKFPGGVKLGMRVQLRLLKGRRDRCE